MNPLLAIDTIALASNIILLYILGYYDKKYRIVPLIPFLMYLVTALILMSLRLYYTDEITEKVIYISLLATVAFIMGLVPISFYQNLIGIGDILVMLIAGIMTPYAPIGEKVKLLPIITPLSAILAVAIIYVIRGKITVYKADFPPGYRSVIKVRASWLKKQEVIKAYPVFIPGMGFVYEEIFKSDDPREATKELLKNVDDDIPIYVLPNFPFVYYYWISFTVISLTLTGIGVVETLLG